MKHKDLVAAYDQLLKYREDLENPPLLVVCDMDRFEVHTNFPNTVKRVYAFDLEGLAEPENLDVLRKLFSDPHALKPGQTSEAVTRQVAEQFGHLADQLRIRGVEAERAAHFLMKLMFCMFAEDIGLLPQKLFSRLLASSAKNPDRCSGYLKELFQEMATGGDFWGEDVLHFFPTFGSTASAGFRISVESTQPRRGASGRIGRSAAGETAQSCT